MVMSVHPGLRPSDSPSVRQFSTLFSNMLWRVDLKFCIWLCFTVLQIKFECRQFASSLWELCPFWNLEYWKYSFRTFLLHAFTYWAEFCIRLCFTVLQIKFEWRHFASISVGVMPLLVLRILEIHSFPHFSLTCFDILSWNFAYDFFLLYYRSRMSVVNLRQFLWELCPFWNSEYWKYTVFRTFLLHTLTYWAEILHMTLFYCNSDQVQVSSICVNFGGSYAPFGT